MTYLRSSLAAAGHVQAPLAFTAFFLISQANLPPHSAFPEPHPLFFLTFVSAEVGSSRRLRDRGVRSGLGSRRDSTAARPGYRSWLPTKPAGSPEGARGAEPPRRGSHSCGESLACSAGATAAAWFPPGPSSNMSPNLTPRVRAARQRPMDSSRRPGRPPAARQPPGKSRPPGARAARATASGNGCHFAGALYYPRTRGSHFASLSLMHVPWGSRWGPLYSKVHRGLVRSPPPIPWHGNPQIRRPPPPPRNPPWEEECADGFRKPQLGWGLGRVNKGFL